jgi:hypothetical protein
VPLKLNIGAKPYEHQEYGKNLCKCKDHGKDFSCPQYFQKHESTHTGEKQCELAVWMSAVWYSFQMFQISSKFLERSMIRSNMETLMR